MGFTVLQERQAGPAAGPLAGRRLVFADSIKLLLSGEAETTRRFIDGLESKGCGSG